MCDDICAWDRSSSVALLNIPYCVSVSVVLYISRCLFGAGVQVPAWVVRGSEHLSLSLRKSRSVYFALPEILACGLYKDRLLFCMSSDRRYVRCALHEDIADND